MRHDTIAAMPPPLHFGPYTAPKARLGDTVVCAKRGRLVVRGFTSGPMPWPTGLVGRGKVCIILCGDLVRAVRRESAAAVAAHWGVST